MAIFNWSDFLQRWSQEIQKSTQKHSGQCSEGIQKEEWLGYPGATEEQIIQVETRLKISLPPSYRDFLKVSNGWSQLTPFIYRVWSVEEIDWFYSRHQTWIETFVAKQLKSQHDSSQNGISAKGMSANGARSMPHISDADYFLYGDVQDCSKIRYEYLQTALEISDKGESSIYLLNPKVKTSDGEWEAWFFGDWLPGADRYPSFRDMMEAEYANFLEMKEVL